MKLFFHILCASICVTSLSAMDINFFADAETFYKRDGGILARSAPIDIYNQIIEDKPVSAQRAKQALHSLHSILAIRKQLSEKYPGARLFDRRSGGFFGGPSPDYTENALTIISAKLAEKAGENREAPMPLESIRTDIVEKITPIFTQAENARLNKLVELETRASETNTPQRTLDIEKLARELGVTDQLPQEFKEQPEVPALPPKETVETRKQRLMRKIDDIIDVLNTNAETVDVGEAKFNTGIRSILARRPQDLELKDINATARAIIAAIAGGDWSLFRWEDHTIIKSKISPEEIAALKNFSDPKNVSWILLYEPWKKDPKDFFTTLTETCSAASDRIQKVCGAIAVIFDTIHSKLSNNAQMRLWVDYEYGAGQLFKKLRLNADAQIAELVEQKTNDLIQAITTNTAQLPIGKAYRIGEMLLQQWLSKVINFVAIHDIKSLALSADTLIKTLPSQLNELEKAWKQELTQNIKGSSTFNLRKMIWITAFAELYYALSQKNAAALGAEQFAEKYLRPTIEDWRDIFGSILNQENVARDIANGFQFISYTSKSQKFKNFKNSILGFAPFYDMTKSLQEQEAPLQNLANDLSIDLPRVIFDEPESEKIVIENLQKFAESLTALANTSF